MSRTFHFNAGARTGRALGFTLSLSLGLFASHGWAFSLEDVAVKAEKLATQDYAPPQSNLPPVFRNMAFADYQQLRFRGDKALWKAEPTPFELQFYHQGMHFNVPVRINEITANGVEKIRYEPEMFEFGNVEVEPAALENLGFAGFKVLYPLNKADKADELMTLLGASYFRVIGKDQVYGLSARGLAIDTALPSGEEFPRFREFWVERPQADRRNLVIYALLDSPRATGAYRMVVTPGKDSTVDVQARVYLREPVEKLGLGALTSMYLFGANQPSQLLNYRPQLHDSEGLAIHTGNDEWIWRPLNNPKRLSISSYSVENPRGFGLLQRTRDFGRYEDLDDRYELRPSGWVEPKGDWGKGRVELIEIPTPDETNDNIVAFWVPEERPEPGKPLDFAYRLHFTMDEPALHDPDLAWVSQTRLSTGDVKQSNLIRQPDGSTALIVDFVGPNLAALAADAAVSTRVSIGENAELVENNLRHNPVTKGWRLTLRLKVRDPKRPVELRAALVEGEKTLSETWSYQIPTNE